MRGSIEVLPAKRRFYAWWLGLVTLTLALSSTSCGAAMEGEATSPAPQAAGALADTPPPAAPPAPGMPGEPEADMSSGNTFGAPAPPPPPPSDASGEPAKVDSSAVLASEEKPAPLLIYRATLTMAVFETKKVMDIIEALAKGIGGYLVTRDDLSITVRVPASKFDGALNDIAKQGDELHRQVEVSDVTAEFNDLSIELKNAEVVRERLVALLEKAQKVEEALAVEAELARLTDKIERIKGKLKLLRELVAFSTVTVRFEARPVERVDSHVQLPFPWLKQLGLVELLSL